MDLVGAHLVKPTGCMVGKRDPSGTRSRHTTLLPHLEYCHQAILASTLFELPPTEPPE